MCRCYYIRAETSKGQPHPDLPESVEFDSYIDLEGRAMCLCGLDRDDDKGELTRTAFMDALRPFLKAVAWGHIIIEVR